LNPIRYFQDDASLQRVMQRTEDGQERGTRDTAIHAPRASVITRTAQDRR